MNKMNKQGYEEMIDILTLIVNKQYDGVSGICGAVPDSVPGFVGFYVPHVLSWEDIAASHRKHYPISTAESDKYESARWEYWEAQKSHTMYADTPYGDARRRLAAFLRSKAEEELERLIGEDR